MDNQQTHDSSKLLQERYKDWHVTVWVLLSLLLQSLLLLLVTFRKRTANVFLSYLVCGIYFLCSKVSFAAFSFIFGAWLFDKSKTSLDLWAAIMLLHYVGQQRLTSYSLDDNGESTFKLVTKLVIIKFGLCFIQKMLSFPTKIIFYLFVVRLIFTFFQLKLGTQEMMLFRYLFDDSDLRQDRHHQLMKVAGRTDTEDPLIVRRAHFLLKSSLLQLAESKPRHEVLEQVREFFRNIEDPIYAIRITEIELNFIYESFHTDGTIRKHFNHNWSIIYAVLRSFESSLCVITLIFFISTSSTHLQSETISRADYIVTNLLLWGTVTLELISYIKTVFSDWTIASLRSNHYCHKMSEILFLAVPQRRHSWSNYPIYNTAPRLVRYARILFRRWSETISKFNFISYSIQTGSTGPELKSYMRQLDELMGIQNLTASFRFVSEDWVSDQLGKFVFDKLQHKPTDIISVLKANVWPTDNSFKVSVLEWHLTTELLFHDSRGRQEADDPSRSCSKLLSDYMAYLLFMKPHFLPKSRFNPLDISEEVQKSIQNIAQRHPAEGKNIEDSLRKFCEEIFNRISNGEDLPENVLSRAIAKTAELRNGDREALWSKISEEWADILVYAASKYDELEHVRGLCQGGELISIVWLLAFHLRLFPEKADTSFTSSDPF